MLQSHCKDYDSGGHSVSTAYVRTAANAGDSPSPSVSVRVAKNANVNADGSTTSASMVASNLAVTPEGARFDKPLTLSASLNLMNCALSGDASWFYAPGVAATNICTNGSSYYPVYGAKILYSNVSAGTSGTVTINETASNFHYMEIFFRTNDGERNSTRVYQPNGKVANLTSARITGAAGAGWIKSKQIQISGTSLAYVGYAGESQMTGTGGANYVGGTLIYLVVGYKWHSKGAKNMALSKRITLQNGVQVHYHRVVRVDKIVNVQNVVEVASYTSRAKREEERAALAGEDPTMDVYVETGIYEALYDPEMTPEAAYAWVKANVPVFEGAVDVLEEEGGGAVA